MKKSVTLLLFCTALCALAVLISCASAGNAGAGATPPPPENAPAPKKLPAPAETPPQAGLSLDEAVERAAADIGAKLPKGTKLAVVSFASESPQVSGYLMEELNFALLDRGLVVTDRANLESVRKELNFQMTAEVDEKTAQSIGKFLGVEYVVTGQFVFTGEEYRFRVITEHTKTVERVAASNLTVRNDSRMKRLAETLNKSAIQTHSAGY